MILEIASVLDTPDPNRKPRKPSAFSLSVPLVIMGLGLTAMWAASLLGLLIYLAVGLMR